MAVTRSIVDTWVKNSNAHDFGDATLRELFTRIVVNVLVFMLTVVQAKSLTAANLIRRQRAAIYYLAANRVAWIQASAGHGRVCDADPDRQIFPLAVYRVKVDRASSREAAVRLLSGPTFSAAGDPALFSEELFEELGRTDT